MGVGAIIVAASGAFLVVFAVAIFVAPRRAERFLRGFASSRRAHMIEQVLRLVAGAGFVVYAPAMRIPLVFVVFGWVLVVTAVCLMMLPWRWHERFGQWAIPLAIRHMRRYGAGAGVLGVFVLAAMR